jgi:hypothetical protein
VDCPILDFGALPVDTTTSSLSNCTPFARLDCSCSQHKGCGGQQQYVGEVRPSQWPREGCCATELEENNNGSFPAPRLWPHITSCSRDQSLTVSKLIFLRYSVLHQARLLLLKLPALRFILPLLPAPRQLLQSGRWHGTTTYSAKKHLP